MAKPALLADGVCSFGKDEMFLLKEGREEGKTPMSNWYAVQVTTGKEEETSLVCRKLVLAETLQECFIPRGERMRRYEGRDGIRKRGRYFPAIFSLSRIRWRSFIMN